MGPLCAEGHQENGDGTKVHSEICHQPVPQYILCHRHAEPSAMDLTGNKTTTTMPCNVLQDSPWHSRSSSSHLHEPSNKDHQGHSPVGIPSPNLCHRLQLLLLRYNDPGLEQPHKTCCWSPIARLLLSPPEQGAPNSLAWTGLLRCWHPHPHLFHTSTLLHLHLTLHLTFIFYCTWDNWRSLQTFEVVSIRKKKKNRFRVYPTKFSRPTVHEKGNEITESNSQSQTALTDYLGNKDITFTIVQWRHKLTNGKGRGSGLWVARQCTSHTAGAYIYWALYNACYVIWSPISAYLETFLVWLARNTE